MIHFEEFGLTSIVVDKIFVVRRNAEGTEAMVYSECGAPIPMDGEDARLFIAYVREKGRRPPSPSEEPGPLIYAPETAPRPAQRRAESS